MPPKQQTDDQKELAKKKTEAIQRAKNQDAPDAPSLPKKDTPPPPKVKKPDIFVLSVSENMRLFGLINALQGKGLIGDIRKLLEEFDLTSLPDLIDQVTTIMAAGKPKDRPSVTAMIDNMVNLLQTFASATSTTVDDQFALIAGELAESGTTRAFVEKIVCSWMGIAYQPFLNVKNIALKGIDIAALIQLITIIYELIQSFWSKDD